MSTSKAAPQGKQRGNGDERLDPAGPAVAAARFPADSVLLDRGRYATLSSEKRAHLRGLRDDMETLAVCSRTILNHAQGIGGTSIDDQDIGLPFAQAKMAIAEERLRAAKIRLGELAKIEPQMTTLRPLAWPKNKEVHDE